MKINLPVTKGIIFAGCSFTWGQGLYYYSNLSTLKDGVENRFNIEDTTHTQIEYMKSVRYPRIVANHFKSFEILYPLNGGAHSQMIKWWEAALGMSSDTHVDSLKVQKIDISEVSTVVFQLTQPHRCSGLRFDDKTTVTYFDGYSSQYRDRFERWLSENNLNFDEYETYYTNKSLETVQNFLIKCEERGLKVAIINWPRDNVESIKSNKWISDRFVPLTYKNNIYYDIETLMKEHPRMKISTDYESFQTPPKDDHPSLMCHNLIAENLINYLQND